MKHYAYGSPFTMKDKEGNKYTLEVMQDECPDDPRRWGSLCTMICWHRRYKLGDDHSFESPDEFMQHLYLDVTENIGVMSTKATIGMIYTRNCKKQTLY